MIRSTKNIIRHDRDNMKYPNLEKWKYGSELEGLLFFAQVVEELLFDYKIDIYKVPAMNLLAALFWRECYVCSRSGER